jgi:thymidine phosphorylase
MAKGEEIRKTNSAEIENLIEKIRGTNLKPSVKEKIERLLRNILILVELLQRKNSSIKKTREMAFGKRTERKFFNSSKASKGYSIHSEQLGLLGWRGIFEIEESRRV